MSGATIFGSSPESRNLPIESRLSKDVQNHPSRAIFRESLTQGHLSTIESHLIQDHPESSRVIYPLSQSLLDRIARYFKLRDLLCPRDIGLHGFT